MAGAKHPGHTHISSVKHVCHLLVSVFPFVTLLPFLGKSKLQIPDRLYCFVVHLQKAVQRYSLSLRQGEILKL